MAYERIVPGTIEWDLYEGNHKARYLFARDVIKSAGFKKVLDAATGVGYGAKILSEVADEIIAVDRDETALQIANSQFKNNRIIFLKDDCEKLESLSAQFDAVVSFETLEHLKHPEKFLKRCFELIRPGGLFMVSTPNQLVSGHKGKKDWEFHEKEYKPVELKNIVVDAGFKDVEIFGQFYTETGLLRNQFRSELNRIHSNPFMRTGKWIQKISRGIKDRAVLPEMLSDFEIRKFQINYDASEEQQPFVLIVVAKK